MDDVKVIVQRSDLVTIANTVRKKTGKSEELTLTEINASIDSISGGSSSEVVEYSEAEDAMVTGILTTYTNDRATTIRNHAFAGCSSLTTVSFPVATTIGYDAFAYCSKLATVSFPVATTIGNHAFEHCSNLTTVSFPAATSIGEWAFYGCSSLTTASFPVATTIGENAFAYCFKLATVSFPVATSIGRSAFDQCYSLATVSFPVATTIGGCAFQNCKNLTTVSFPVATTIGYAAFRYCSKLATVSFPVATTIGENAFDYCYNLKSLYLTNSVVCTLSNSNVFTSTPIGGYSASAGTYGSIYVPGSLFTRYQSATNWTYFSSRFVAIGDVPQEPDEEDGGEIITFSIKNDFVPDGKTTSYTAEQGMTWEEWFSSIYNTTRYKISGSNIMQDNTPMPSSYIYYNNVKVDITDKIIVDAIYIER